MAVSSLAYPTVFCKQRMVVIVLACVNPTLSFRHRQSLERFCMSKFGIFLTDIFAETLKVEFRQMRGFANRRFDFQVSPSNGKMAMCDSVGRDRRNLAAEYFSLSKRPPWTIAHMVGREEQDPLVALLLLSHDEGDIDHDEFLQPVRCWRLVSATATYFRH